MDRSGRGGDNTPNAAGPDSSGGDPVLLALEDLVHAAGQVQEAIERLNSRAAYIRACRQQGVPYRHIVTQEDRPLIAGTAHRDHPAIRIRRHPLPPS